MADCHQTRKKKTKLSSQKKGTLKQTAMAEARKQSTLKMKIRIVRVNKQFLCLKQTPKFLRKRLRKRKLILLTKIGLTSLRRELQTSTHLLFGQSKS